jgi:hypothetical protein
MIYDSRDRLLSSDADFNVKKCQVGMLTLIVTCMLQWCMMPERGLPEPDLVLYMRVSPEEATSRGGYGEERYEKAEFQKKVWNFF